jgi:hypothetical protein
MALPNCVRCKTTSFSLEKLSLQNSHAFPLWAIVCCGCGGIHAVIQEALNKHEEALKAIANKVGVAVKL